jgi:hypothetical protein
MLDLKPRTETSGFRLLMQSAGNVPLVRRFGARALVFPPILVLLAYLGVSKFNGASDFPRAEFDALYDMPLSPPAEPLRVFHLGHSLVGRDMPAMLRQLAGPGQEYNSQLGWGTSLKSHWEQCNAIAGFAEENAHDRYRDVREALTSGTYDAFVATEMVEIRDAIKYHQSGKYLASWAALARKARPGIRIYLYETWHRTDDPEGWVDRLDLDLGRYWESDVLRPALSADPSRNPIYVIPAGTVFAAFVRAVEAAGGVDNISGKEALFATATDGTPDPIHLNDLGAYLVALTHYAVLYQKSPVGLPHQLLRADGTPAVDPGETAARLMQETVWRVVTSYRKTGVATPDAR